MQREKTHESEDHCDGPVAEPESSPGRAQRPAPPEIEEDIEAIRELLGRIGQLRAHPTTHAHDDLAAPLAFLETAVGHHDTDAKPVREALQQVLLTVGTGALATLGDPARRRLAALTGIALPGCGSWTPSVSTTYVHPTRHLDE